MPNYVEICNRWHHATVRNSPLAWDAIRCWLAAEAAIARADHYADESVESLTTLSSLAHRHALDLYPQREQDAA